MEQSVIPVVQHKIPEIFGNNSNAEELVTITVQVPRGALDLLGFRYFPLKITENDQALVSTAVQEMAFRQLSSELSGWQYRTNLKKIQH